ncbi:MAG: hypothetical protein M3O70_02710 [Actinomycetota bacterium]|nr:hypothetical protein [Actinomycetota bacterium]
MRQDGARREPRRGEDQLERELRENPDTPVRVWVTPEWTAEGFYVGDDGSTPPGVPDDLPLEPGALIMRFTHRSCAAEFSPELFGRGATS